MIHRIHVVLVVAASLAALSCQESRTYQEPAPPQESPPTPEPVVVAPPEAPVEEVVPPGSPEPPEPATLSQKDATFVDKAGQGGMREVVLSRIAKDHASRQDVKQLAERMIDEHTKIGSELEALLAERSLDKLLPTAPDATTASLEAELATLQGKKLDKRYLEIMLEDHAGAVDLFRDESTGGDDVALRAWVTKTLPTIESHLEHVKLVKAGKKVPPQMQAPKVGALTEPRSRAGGHAH